MTPSPIVHDILPELDDSTRALVRLAAVVAAGNEEAVRATIAREGAHVPEVWAEELLLQTYLFAGFPRAVNGMREWRRVHPTVAVVSGEAVTGAGEATCARVYGSMYDRLRENIRRLHPLLDDWMIDEGYGKVLSRPGLDLPRRELCIVAACAATNQDRQLHSHLHGARNAGASVAAVDATIESLSDLIGTDRLDIVSRLWAKVRAQ